MSLSGFVCVSSEISPEFREFERASTTIINAYVGPLMDRYLGELERESPHKVSIMQSNGGLLTASEARRRRGADEVRYRRAASWARSRSRG